MSDVLYVDIYRLNIRLRCWLLRFILSPFECFFFSCLIIFYLLNYGFPSFHLFIFEIEEKSIACNLCATCCSSCVHFHRVAAIPNVEIGDFSDNTSTEKRAYRCPCNGCILISSLLRSACGQLTSSGRETFKCLSKQGVPSLARVGVTISGLGSCQIGGTYRYATFGGADAYLSCFETESHLYGKNHLFLESVTVIESTSMQESQQLQLGNPRDVSNLMEVEVTVCDTCGVQGKAYKLAICHKCPDGAQHTYCMRVMPDKVPDGEWACEECLLREGTEKLVLDNVKEPARRTKRRVCEGSVNPESSKAIKSKVRSSLARKSGENRTGAFTRLSAKGHKVPLESQSVKKTTELNAISPRPSEPNNHSPLSEDSCEKAKRKKRKSINELVYSVPQRSTTYPKKAMVPHAYGDREHMSSFTKSDKKRRHPETSVISSNHVPLQRETPSKETRKVKLEAAGNDSSLEQFSSGIGERANLPYCIDYELPKSGSQTKIAGDKCSLLKPKSSKPANLKSDEQPEKASCMQKQMVERNPEKSGKATIPGGQTFFSGSCFYNSDAVESAGKLDLVLQDPRTHKEPNCPNEKKKNERQQAQHPTKAATDINLHKLCTGSASDESSFCRELARVEAAFSSQGFAIPKFHCSWLGKFQIHNNVGIAGTCDGIQAHVSTRASHRVPDAANRLPEIIILEKLPRLRIWPPQFMGSRITEENIGLYFFATDLDSYETHYSGLMDHMVTNDLALKANLDGVELLIFPSNILPEKSQRWNQMFFFWGVFRGKKVNNSSITPMTNSLKLGDGDNVKSLPFDQNAYGDNMARPSGDRTLLVGDSSNSKEGEEEAEFEAANAILDFTAACRDNIVSMLRSCVIRPVK